MYRHCVDVIPLVKNSLCAVTVVQIDINDCDTFMDASQFLRSDGAVVEVAKTTCQISEAMMSRRSAKRIAHPFALKDCLRC